jgi:hypothetical protein
MAKNQLTTQDRGDESGHKMADVILDFVGHVPHTEEHKNPTPANRARSVANGAAAKAALAAGGLALPPGPTGWLTILPELIAVWKLQAQMVADIAGIYGKTASLTREHMVYCLFRHSAAQAVRDLVVRVGERFLIRRVSPRALQLIAQKLGVRITQQAVGKGMSRLLPFVGALGVGAYAYYDTGQVAKTAIELFERDAGFAAEDQHHTPADDRTKHEPDAPSRRHSSDARSHAGRRN